MRGDPFKPFDPRKIGKNIRDGAAKGAAKEIIKSTRDMSDIRKDINLVEKRIKESIEKKKGHDEFVTKLNREIDEVTRKRKQLGCNSTK
ncbi:MAG: hypothetical protein GKS00_09400 [Alphaproteobacteria bacterium]|nr:hypothetical protein [Alphaproteobacteria bacterium]